VAKVDIPTAGLVPAARRILHYSGTINRIRRSLPPLISAATIGILCGCLSFARQSERRQRPAFFIDSSPR
jgi:hypothetical protein